MENTIGGLVTGTCTVGSMLQGNELCAILCYLLIRLRIICCVPVLFRLYNQTLMHTTTETLNQFRA